VGARGPLQSATVSEVTRILDRVQQGEGKAAEELLQLVYGELRKLAAQEMYRQPPGQTLQATALVHEAWLKLAGDRATSWNDRGHFFRAAAEAMRQILIDKARAKKRLKRGGSQLRLDIEHLDLASETEPEILLIVEEALEALAQQDPLQAELIKLRFYVGLTVPEIAQVLGVSERTVKRRWIHARAWLFQEIRRLWS
jgi:RNA polymerase sigma factor (TIGR02999 family)